MKIWYHVIRLFGAEAARFPSYQAAVEYKDKHCSSGRVVPSIEFYSAGVPRF